jgi:hypothetical protein
VAVVVVCGVDEGASTERGQRTFRVVIEEAVQDNHYELRLDFDKHTFAYVYKRVAFEGGDGFYETTHRGAFTCESTGGARKGSGSGFKKGPSKKNLLSAHSTATAAATATPASPPPEPSPRRPEPSSYYVCKVDVRDYRSDWEPWDKRQAPEKVSRKGDTFHQELLFKCLNANEIINENVAPACVMTVVDVKK